MSPTIGVLALQGAFKEHIDVFSRLGVAAREIRSLKDLEGVDAVVIPGGESTTIGKLLVELDIMPRLREMVANGTPIFGTCAGMILLSDEIEGGAQPRVGGLRAKVRRNAFGSQVDSFEKDLPMPALGEAPFPAVFIRAPLLSEIGDGVETLASLKEGNSESVVAARQGNILVAAFHPELTSDDRIHKYFLEMIK